MTSPLPKTTTEQTTTRAFMAGALRRLSATLVATPEGHTQAR